LSNDDEMSSGGCVFEGEDMLLVRDLVKIYPGPVTALAGVDLDVPNGMFGLLGPNGAGKTTLMRILAGLLEPTSGSATLDGESILDHPEQIWGRLGYLPQDFGFFPHLTGEQMLEYLLRLKGISATGGLRSLCRGLLERVNLSFAARRKVKTYSGGMRQRLGIAQAIAGNPRVIIVDEPTAGLDPEERLRFYRLLSELAADRIVLLSTHIVDDVAVLCTRFAVIRSGRLIAYTSPVAARIAIEGTIFEGTVSAHTYDHLLADPERCVTQAYLVEGQNRVRVYQPARQPPAGFVPVGTTLEDAYLVLIKTGFLPGLDHEWLPKKIADAVPHDGFEFSTALADRGGK
jgi:ABC-2 type transport system ATP-binding protein